MGTYGDVFPRGRDFQESVMWYFVPRQTGTAALLTAARLGYAFDDSPAAILADATLGPNGLSGTILSAQSGTPPKINWRKRDLSPDGAQLGVWFGWNDADPPGPESLARGGMLRRDWASVKLRDGRSWLVPLVEPCRDRDANRRHQLPGPAASSMTFEPDAKYDGLRFSLSRIFERAISEGELIAIAAELLAVGYRVALAEVLALGLLDQVSAHAVVCAAIDFHERIAVGAVAEDPDACALLIRGLATEWRVDEKTAGAAAVKAVGELVADAE